MSELKKVRVIQGFMDGYHFYAVGNILRPSGVTRDLWLRRRLIELVDEEDNTAKPVSVEVRAKRKRGRPRKVSAL